MVTCENCGGTNFDSEEGFYFCLDCNTQSQNIQDFEEGEEFREISRVVLKSQIKEPKEQNAKKQKKSAGRPWRTQEGFNIILREQVRTLIQLGAPPKLKDVVLQLWALYLSKTEAAFTGVGADENFVPKLCVRPRDRDIQMTSTDDPIIRQQTSKRKELMEELKKKLVLQRNMETEDEVIRDSIKGSYNQQFNSIERMRLIHTICFCYIGLTYLKSTILLVDLLRWIDEGHLPFMNAATFFPKDMKFCTHDSHTFCPQVIPSTFDIRKETGHLIRFLHLTNFPSAELNSISHRFILELNLPGEMHSLVTKLINIRPPICSWNVKKVFINPPSFEMRAMAFIILTLKYLFGLDDKMEKLHSHTAINVNEVLGTDQKLFVWSDWVEHIQLRQHLMKNYASNIASLSRSIEAANTKSIVTYDENVAKHWGANRTYLKEPEYRRKCQMIFIQPFTLLIEKEFENLDRMKQQPSSFPGLAFIQNFFKIPCYFKDDLSPSDTQILKRNFGQKSLKFLSDPETFLEEMNEQEIQIVVANSSHNEKTNIKILKKHGHEHSNQSNSILFFPPKDETIFTNKSKISKSLHWLINICSEVLGYPCNDLLKDVEFIESAVLKTIGSSRKKVYWMNY